MPFLFHILLTWIVYPIIALFVLAVTYAISGLAQLMIVQYCSHLGELNCPPVPSFFWGHLQLLHDAENTNLYMHWMEQFGTIFTYRGFIGGRRLVTMDTRAIGHIVSRPHQYQKPGFVRDTLASMAGEQGLLVVEGEAHSRQRKILSPSFTAPQVRELIPIFYDKAAKLRDIWLSIVDTVPDYHSTPPAVKTLHIEKPSHRTLLSPATPTLPLTPPPRSPSSTIRLRNKANLPRSPSEGSTFALSQSLPPRPPLIEEARHDPDSSEEEAPYENNHSFIRCTAKSPSVSGPRVRIDVLNWLGRATLDVIGLAGFGYAFDALVDDQNELATAFAEVFTAARKFRFITVLQAWFPILHYFHANRKSTDHSLQTMHQIGMGLIHRAQERVVHSGEAPVDIDFREGGKSDSDDVKEHIKARLGSEQMKQRGNDEGALKGRDLLSLLIKSNLATADKERMSQEEILSQISTFMAAGHETTSSALTWTLYILSQNPACQSRLRSEVSSVLTSTPSPEALNALPYLDMVVRESLRLHSPVSQTMRVATIDDVIPVAVPYCDAKGRTRGDITIKKGDIISIPIQTMNKSKHIFGEDAENFIPERWEHPPDPNVMPTLYSSILTFWHGGRACIGYRFALLEMKVFLFVLIRSLCFETCPDIVIEKRLNVVTRPLVKSEPERGNQMPLLLSRVSSTPLPLSSPPHNPIPTLSLTQG